MASGPKVEDIITELMRRLSSEYPRVFLQRGFFAEENTIWPALYVDEGLIESLTDRLSRKGMYDRIATISLAYFFKCDTNLATALRTANLEKFKLCTAIETDNDFSGLCTKYGEVEFDKVFYKPNGIQISVEYSFEYSEESPWATATARRM